MRILAIDQSYTSTGLIVFTNNEVTHAEIVRSNPSRDIYERAWDICNFVATKADEFLPDIIGLEGLAFSKFGNATRDLAGLQFTMITLLRFIKKYRIVIVPPNTVKKIATGRGNAKKEELFKTLPEEIKDKFKEMGALKTKGLYDLTDAYWIGKSVIETVIPQPR